MQKLYGKTKDLERELDQIQKEIRTLKNALESSIARLGEILKSPLTEPARRALLSPLKYDSVRGVFCFEKSSDGKQICF